MKVKTMIHSFPSRHASSAIRAFHTRGAFATLLFLLAFALWATRPPTADAHLHKPASIHVTRVASGVASMAADTSHPLVPTLIAMTIVPPITPDDTGKSAFAKLVVKNLGPLVNSKYKDFSPTITADGKTMFFVSDRPPSQKQDFWMTTSPDGNDTVWTSPTNVTEINSPADDGAASIAADGQTIYFATSRQTTSVNDVDIWQATLNGTHWE
ncbi:MAG TPA: hypothetical protein VFD13_05545, partial [Candidatus Kapabacteria bacterium]|nr:hypothetical protein [Candidatus Kapabacteria bacterium]